MERDPALLTAAEAVVYLRLDNVRCLEYLRRDGRLQGVRVGKRLVYPLGEIERFVRDEWERQHPRAAWPERTQ